MTTTSDVVNLTSVSWVFVTGALPPNAIVGGREADGRQIWIARAPYAGGWHPGKIDRGVMYISYGGKEIVIDKGYQVLTGIQSAVRWVQVSGRFTLESLGKATPVHGGNEADGRSYWIAQGTVPTTTVIVSPGKVKLGSFAHFPYEGKEHIVINYSVLVYANTFPDSSTSISSITKK